MQAHRIFLFAALGLVAASGCVNDTTDDGSTDIDKPFGNGSSAMVPGYPGAGADGIAPLVDAELLCFYRFDTDDTPIAAVEYGFETINNEGVWHVRLTFDPNFVDNSYGENSIGWKKRGHTMKDLDKSDHAEMLFVDGAGNVALQLKTDYITSAAAGEASGFDSLGVWGGDGRMVDGPEQVVLAATSSLDRNLNERGYGDYVVDSPATNDRYEPSAEAPNWDYRVVYEVYLADAAFKNGWGGVTLEYVHASPSKMGEDTWFVWERECPPSWNPPTNNPPTNTPPGDEPPTDEPPPQSTPPTTPDPVEPSCNELATCSNSCANLQQVCVNGCCIDQLY
jgi:hypothetical protein